MSLTEGRLNSPWCDGATGLLVRLYNEGLTGRKIAEAVSAQFNVRVTRRAVVNKAIRLSLPPRRIVRSPEQRKAHNAEMMRKWRAAHKDEINAYRREQWASRPREIREYDPERRHNIANSPWTVVVVDRLTELWLANVKVADIRETINSEFGLNLTHRAVMRKAHRTCAARQQLIGREGHFKWEPYHEARVTDLWCAGVTAQIIAEKMTAEFGGRPFTRNGVISKVRKLGLPGRPRGGSIAETDPVKLAARAERRREMERNRQRVRRAKSPRQPSRQSAYKKKIELRLLAPQVEDWSIPTPQRKSLLELGEHDCRWPVGEPQSDQFFFCGAVAEDSRPYCSGHCQRAYVEIRPR